MSLSIKHKLLIRLMSASCLAFASGLFGGLFFTSRTLPHALSQKLHLDQVMEQPLLAFLVLGLPLLTLLGWWWIKQSFHPIVRIARDIEKRSDHNLIPLPRQKVPAEMQPVTHALNKLFEQLKATLEREQRFASDAAHELRTPLAVLNTHIQLAEQTDDPAKRSGHLKNVQEGVTRCTHIIEQLLNLSRMTPETHIETQAVDLNHEIQNMIATLVPRALEKNINITFHPHQHPAPIIEGNATSLGILIRNLVDNAVRYTPDQGQVVVRTQSTHDAWLLEVEDNGPGIPQEKRERVFERFYRELGNQESGCGLGLGIVKQIVDVHDARIRCLSSTHFPSGLLMQVGFPKQAH